MKDYHAVIRRTVVEMMIVKVRAPDQESALLKAREFMKDTGAVKGVEIEVPYSADPLRQSTEMLISVVEYMG